jgi:hypothetical protein
MKTAIRLFALFVAFTGLAAAGLAPAKTQIHASHNSVTAKFPGPLVNIPAPLPCQSVNACVAPTTSSK